MYYLQEYYQPPKNIPQVLQRYVYFKGPLYDSNMALNCMN